MENQTEYPAATMWKTENKHEADKENEEPQTYPEVEPPFGPRTDNESNTI